MAADLSAASAARVRADWEGCLLRWGNAALEGAVFYLLLAAWARPRDGQALLLPMLACLTLFLAMAVRVLLDSTTVAESTCLLAIALAALAWAFVVARACAAPGYWLDGDSPRVLLLLGAVFGGRDSSGFQPLAFWVSLLLWWRGHALLTWTPDFDEALGRFRLGCLVTCAAVGLAAASEASGGDIVQLEQLFVIAVFLSAGLLTTGLSRRREMAGGAPAAPTIRGGARAPRSRLALAPVVVAVAALLTLAVAAWGAEWLSPQALAPAVEVAGLALAAIGAVILGVFQFIGSLWPSITPPATQEPPRYAGESGPDRFAGLATAMLALFGPLMVIGTLVGMIAVAILLYMAVHQGLASDFESSQVRAVDGNDDTEPTLVAPRGPATVLALLVRLLHTLLNRPRAAVRQTVSSISAVPSEPGMVSIRAVYRAYLAWAATRGCTRGAAETPDEFGRRLVNACPEAEAETALLTSLYVAARYGGQPCSPVDIRRAELAVGRLRYLPAGL